MLVVNEATSRTLVAGDYVLRRWEERGDGDRGSLEAHLRQAVPWGAQRGDDVLYAHDGHVFPCQRAGGNYAVKTVLTREMAVVNMQRAGLPARLPHKTTPTPRLKDPDTFDAGAIALLAAQHAWDGWSKDRRNVALREAGLDPNSAVATVYRVAHTAAAAVLDSLLAGTQAAHEAERDVLRQRDELNA